MNTGFRVGPQGPPFVGVGAAIPPVVAKIIKDATLPTRDELQGRIGKLRGPEHDEAVEFLVGIVKKGREDDVQFLFPELEKKGFGQDFDPIYFALSDRYFNWMGRARFFIDGIR